MLVRRLSSDSLCFLWRSSFSFKRRCFLASSDSVTFPPPFTSDKVFESVLVVGSVAVCVFMLVIVSGALGLFLPVVVVVIVIVAIYVRGSENGYFKQLNVCLWVANWKFVRHQTLQTVDLV